MADRGHFLKQWHLVSLSGTVGDLFGDLFSRCAFQVGLEDQQSMSSKKHRIKSYSSTSFIRA